MAWGMPTLLKEERAYVDAKRPRCHLLYRVVSQALRLYRTYRM